MFSLQAAGVSDCSKKNEVVLCLSMHYLSPARRDSAIDNRLACFDRRGASATLGHGLTLLSSWEDTAEKAGGELLEGHGRDGQTGSELGSDERAQ